MQSPAKRNAMTFITYIYIGIYIYHNTYKYDIIENTLYIYDITDNTLYI